MSIFSFFTLHFSLFRMSRLEENNLKKKLMHNGFRLYVFSFLIAPSGYLLKMMIARELSVEDIGLFYSIIWLISTISTYNDLWLTESLQYFLPKYILKKDFSTAKALLRFTRSMQFITWIAISAILFFWAPWLAKHYFESNLALPLLRIFCLYFLIINLYQVLSSLFLATQQVKRWQFLDFVRMRSIVIFTALSIFFLDSFSVLHYTRYRLYGVIAWSIVACIGAYKLFPRSFTSSNPSIKKHLHIKERTSYGRRVMLGQSAWTLYGQVNQQLVLVFLGTAAAGIWAYYLTFFNMVAIVTWPIISYLFPLLNELYEKWDQWKIKQLYSYLLFWLLLFWILWWIISYLYAPFVSVLLFGKAFREAWVLFQIFAPWIFTSPLLWIVFADIASRGWVKQRAAILFFWLFISAISSYYLIVQAWLVGSAYGHIAGTLSLLFASWYIYKINGFNLKTLWKKPSSLE